MAAKTNDRKTMILKLFISFLLACEITHAYSQGNFVFPEYSFSDVNIQSISKDSVLPVLSQTDEYMDHFRDIDIKKDTASFFYLADVTGDQVKELLYFGQILAEGNWTIVWAVEGKNYKFIGKMFGRLTGINRNPKTGNKLSTFAFGCCGSDCDYANLYSFNSDTLSHEQSVAVFDGVSIPNSDTSFRKPIVLKNPLYNLRAQPIIDNSHNEFDTDRYGVLEGNVIVKLPQGIKAIATAEVSDTTGRVWWFLVLENPLSAEYNVYKGYKLENQRICGWLSTKLLEFGVVDQKDSD